MKRLVFLVAGALFLSLSSCTPRAEETGSKTNWFELCEFDKDCGPDALCICGVCTEPCDDDSCGGQDGGVCLQAEDQRLRASCEAPPSPSTSGVCAAGCNAERACPTGSVCIGGACLRGSPSACDGAFSIELEESPPLFARQGCHVSDGLYVPVQLPGASAWTNDASPYELRFRVADRDGRGIPHCQVRLLSEEGHGLGLALNDTTDEDGVLSALWIAGTERESVLTASVLQSDGNALTASVSADVRAHDEEPQAEDSAAPLVRPSTLVVFYGLPQAARGVRALTVPRAMPHHAFSGAINLPGLYAGLQNTSSEGGSDDPIPDEDRVLITSIWNSKNGDLAEILEASEDVVCEAHTDNEGGLRCNLAAAWELDRPTLFEVTWQILAEGEVGELFSGAETPACTSAGCTDYRVLFYRNAMETGSPDLVVTFRRPESSEPTSARAFLQPYGTTEEQTSCLATPKYETDFSFSALAEGSWNDVTSATAYSVYRPEFNEVCAHYEAHQLGNTFTLATGGTEVVGVPYRPEVTWPVGP